MGIDFNAGSYFTQSSKPAMLEYIVNQLRKRDFIYRPGRGYPDTLDLQINRILNGGDASIWMKKGDCSLLIAIDEVKMDFQRLYLSFVADCIVTDIPEEGQNFLEEIIEVLTQFHTFAKSEITWGGFAEDIVNIRQMEEGRLNNLYWFNIFGPRLARMIGKAKLLGAPAWLVKELPDGSVIIRASEHPHVYEKIGGIYLHEYLGLEYIG